MKTLSFFLLGTLPVLTLSASNTLRISNALPAAVVVRLSNSDADNRVVVPAGQTVSVEVRGGVFDYAINADDVPFTSIVSTAGKDFGDSKLWCVGVTTTQGVVESSDDRAGRVATWSSADLGLCLMFAWFIIYLGRAGRKDGFQR